MCNVIFLLLQFLSFLIIKFDDGDMIIKCRIKLFPPGLRKSLQKLKKFRWFYCVECVICVSFLSEEEEFPKINTSTDTLARMRVS